MITTALQEMKPDQTRPGQIWDLRFFVKFEMKSNSAFFGRSQHFYCVLLYFLVSAGRGLYGIRVLLFRIEFISRVKREL